MNTSDSERIAGFLEARKLKPGKDIKGANLIIFNTCGVRQTAEDRVYGQIHNIRKQESRNKNQERKKTIILTGCLANRKDVQRRLANKVDSFIPIKHFFKIKNLDLFKNLKLKIKNSYTASCDYLRLLPKYSDKFSAYVPIMTGCNNFCSYCVVPYARGRETSRPAGDIISEIKKLAKYNYKEIILLGQNVNSYSHKKVKFPVLLDSLTKKFSNITFKFLTSHPKDFSEKLIEVIAKNNNISKEIHLPLQAGSDKILRAMNRPYTQKHYLGLIRKARKKIPGAAFTTDVIVGFPGETKKDFRETVQVFKKVGYNEAYINKYSPRFGTAAWKLGNPISWEEKKKREKVLRKLIKKTEKITNKIIVILGPTASGKSDVAIRLAQKFSAQGGSALGGNGAEIISADSRQIYRGMDLGTGKITKKEQKKVKHYMLDIASPKTNFSVAQFKKKAEKMIGNILKRGKMPIICGGSGFWIKAIVDNVVYPEVKPDWVLRNKLRNKKKEELFAELHKLDPERAETIDKNNPVRLIRAIEICQALGKVPNIKHPVLYTGYQFLQIGLNLPKEKLYKNIKKRLEKRFHSGMIEEVRRLREKNKISWKRLESFGLGYFWIAKYLKEEIASRKELFEKVYSAEKDYAKRQLTWFSKDKRIKWTREYKEIEKEVKKFLNN